MAGAARDRRRRVAAGRWRPAASSPPRPRTAPPRSRPPRSSPTRSRAVARGPQPRDVMPGANVAVHRDEVLALGGYDERLGAGHPLRRGGRQRHGPPAAAGRGDDPARAAPRSSCTAPGARARSCGGSAGPTAAARAPSTPSTCSCATAGSRSGSPATSRGAPGARSSRCRGRRARPRPSSSRSPPSSPAWPSGWSASGRGRGRMGALDAARRRLAADPRKRAWWHRLRHPALLVARRSTEPLSHNWGFERGTPIDRYYIERFLRTASRRHPRAGSSRSRTTPTRAATAAASSAPT